MLTLLYKDFKLLFASGKVGKWRVLSYVIGVLLVALFVTIETFIVSGILSKLASRQQGSPLAFLAIALFIVSVLMIFVCLTQAKKLFFNEKDSSNLSMMPVRSSEIILSKLLLLFILQYVTGFVFTYPVIATYASIFHLGKQYFYLGVFYPLLAFPFECGVALLLVYPYKLLGDFLKKHTLVQFLVATVVIFALCYLYSRVLNIFVTLVASNNFDSLLSAENVGAMIAARKYMIPVTWLVDIFLGGNLRALVLLLPVGIGALALGAAVCILSYSRLRFVRFHARAQKERKLRVTSVRAALVKKEFTLLFKDSENLFSFTGLLVVQPFLVYLIVSSLNTIFSSGIFAYYVSILDTFLPVMDMLLVILVSLIIAQGANNYISNEAKNIRLIKSVPVGAFTQLFIKVALPFAFVTFSMLVTYVVLLATGCVTAMTALVGFLMTLLIHVIFSVISLYEELKIRNNRTRSYFLSSTFSYVLPILYAAAMIIASYFGLSVTAAYLIGLAVVLASGLPWVIGFKSRVLRLFDALEVVN